MKWSTALIAAVLIVGLSATEAKTQTITITNIDNSNAGQITVTAAVVVPKGWTVNAVLIQARPPKGAAGEGSGGDAKDLGGGKWAVTIIRLTSKNTYGVQTFMEVTDDKGVDRVYFSDTQSTTVK